MDTESAYVVISFGIGENKEFFPMDCSVANSNMAALSQFSYLVDHVRGVIPLIDCMKKYTRNGDIEREIQLDVEYDGVKMLVIISLIKVVTADGYPF